MFFRKFDKETIERWMNIGKYLMLPKKTFNNFGSRKSSSTSMPFVSKCLVYVHPFLACVYSAPYMTLTVCVAPRSGNERSRDDQQPETRLQLQHPQDFLHRLQLSRPADSDRYPAVVELVGQCHLQIRRSHQGDQYAELRRLCPRSTFHDEEVRDRNRSSTEVRHNK
jgi:hypothetical protein